MTCMSPTPNLYHRWAYIDEITASLNNHLDADAKQHSLPSSTIKTLKTIAWLEAISSSISTSFFHPNHPSYIDDERRTDWINSLETIIRRWREIHHQFLTNQPYLNATFTNLIFDHLPALNIDQQLVTRVTADFDLDPIKIKYAHIEPFFRGVHQMTEIALSNYLDRLTKLRREIKNLPVKNMKLSDNAMIKKIRSELLIHQKWWEIAACHIMLLSKMDTASYAEYRQSLLGTSGGDSKQLREAKSLINSLHHCLPTELLNGSIKNALRKDSDDNSLSQLLSSIREAQAAACDFWLRHFTLTANTIGIIKGSQGLPVEKLISFAVAPLMKHDSLVKIVGEIGEEYSKNPEAKLVNMNNYEKIIGNNIYAHIKEEFKFITDHTQPLPTTDNLLDDFILKPLTSNDTHESPYIGWFDGNIHTKSIPFSMHSFGTPLILFNESIQQSSHRLLAAQNNYWDIYFNTRIPQFQQVLFKTLNIMPDKQLSVSIDSNATTLLERLLSALPTNSPHIILSTDQEFLTVNRSLAGYNLQNKVDIQRIKITGDNVTIADNFIKKIALAGDKLKLLIFSHTFSNTQITLTADDILQILDATPTHIPIIIDIVQSAFNVPIHWGNLLKNRHNVYLLGSCIKHGRSTSGLGFVIHPTENGALQHPRQSGWCAYLSGLTSGTTASKDGELLYDKSLEWFGGTPNNVFALDLFINTWDAILRSGETIQSMHQYVQSLHHYLFEKLSVQSIVALDDKRRNLYPTTSSNAMTLNTPNINIDNLLQKAKMHSIEFDQREGNIRIGFGIQHGKVDVDKLVAIF